MKKRSSQDEFVRTALRVPPDLHAQIHDSAKGSGRTFNAELIHLLSSAFRNPAGLSGDLLDRLKFEAAMNARSLAAEVISRVEQSFAPPPDKATLQLQLEGNFSDSLPEILQAVRKLMDEINLPLGAVSIHFLPFGTRDLMGVIEEALELSVSSPQAAVEHLLAFREAYLDAGGEVGMGGG